MLDHPKVSNVAKAIKKLCSDEDLRLELAMAALQRFNLKFKREHYIERWKELLM